MGSGGGGGGDRFTDARLASARQIDGLRARIGDGAALAIRRLRPTGRAGRVAIPDRVLVDMVCLQDRPLGDVLRAHGWTVEGKTVQAATAALSAALERMIGPRRRPDIVFVRTDLPPVWPGRGA
jgi:hypothetical protein